MYFSKLIVIFCNFVATMLVLKNCPIIGEHVKPKISKLSKPKFSKL